MATENISNESKQIRNLPKRRGILSLACACVLLAILIAGLWPFHAPRNQVEWLSDGSGLFFGQRGSIVSLGSFRPVLHQKSDACSFEIWLQPTRLDSAGVIFAFYSTTRGRVSFAIRQWHRGVVLEEDNANYSQADTELYVDDVFSHQQASFLTVTSGDSGTAVYVDGALLKRSSNFRVSSDKLAGEFVIGNSPSSTHSWSGTLKGLAFYDDELSPAKVTQSLANWARKDQSTLSATSGVLARYLFREGRGSLIRNQVDESTDLRVPLRFFVLHEHFLQWPWDEFRLNLKYWKNVTTNIVGFVPFGFFYAAYFFQRRNHDNYEALTVALGFCVSLVIELLQAFLPTRQSGMTDLITNTFGTAIGVFVFKTKAVQTLSQRRRAISEEQDRDSDETEPPKLSVA